MAKSIFHSCRSPAAAAVAPTPFTAPRHHRHPPVVEASSAACCPRRLRRRRPPPCSGAGGSAADADADDLPLARGTPTYRWLKSSRWHVVETTVPATDDEDGATSPRRKIDTSRRRRRRWRVRPRKPPASGSSDDSGWFVSDEESYSYGGEGDETETLVTSTTTECSPGSGNSAGGGVVVGSFAVVKRSDDPRGDFRRSMAEMVVERRIYDADGLERLLRCFLALNDRRHRRDIVAAFGDVWDAVFSNPASRAPAGAGEPVALLRY